MTFIFAFPVSYIICYFNVPKAYGENTQNQTFPDHGMGSDIVMHGTPGGKLNR